MSSWVVASGLLAGLGCWLAISELVAGCPEPAGRLDRLDGCGIDGRPGGWHWSGLLARIPRRDRRAVAAGSGGRPTAAWRERERLARQKGRLGRGWAVSRANRRWFARRQWHSAAWATSVGGTLAAGTAMFFMPDIVTRVTAANRRADFRYALTSYLDLVALERGAGAGPTEALEAAAEIGKGWAFARIAASLGQARRASKPPWDGLAQLAAEIGIDELADVADIAGVAGQEGARILDTLSARAESMRVEALSCHQSPVQRAQHHDGPADRDAGRRIPGTADLPRFLPAVWLT